MKKILFLSGLFIFFAVKSFAAVVPAESGIGSYSDTMPAGNLACPTTYYATSNISAPIPTNDWWSSAISTPTSFRMFAYPNVYKCEYDGLLMGYPDVKITSNDVYYGTDSEAPYRQQLLIGATESFLTASVNVDGYSDWAVKLKWIDKADASKYYTSMLVQGNPFAYFEYSASVATATIRFPHNWALGQYDIYDLSGGIQLWDTIVSTDAIVIRFLDYGAGVSKAKYFGIYAPQSASFKVINSGHKLEIYFNGADRFLSIAALPQQSDGLKYYDYAYSFVTGSTVTWAVDESKSRVTTTFNVYTQAKRGTETKTLMALFPHQWKYSSNSYLSQVYQTLRGTMKVLAGNSFQTIYNFNGMLPFMPDVGSCDKTVLQTMLSADKEQSLDNTGTYYHGKELWNTASLLQIAIQLENTQNLDYIRNRIRNDLKDWFTYNGAETNKCFYYNSFWGSMIGCKVETQFNAQNMNDHHFHYGYFIYASALLGFLDDSFISDYGAMVENLIRDIAAPTRTDPKYPFLRYFLPYQGFGFADGLVVDTTEGNDQESSSEAMNAWAGIYWWGALTNNDTYKNLGIWLYATEYAAIKEYYFDIDDEIYSSGYTHNSVGRLFAGKANYDTWFGSDPEYIKGIQFLPLTPSSLYLGYYPSYSESNYLEFYSENGNQDAHTWKDIFWQFQSFYNPLAAMAKYNSNPSLASSDLENCTKTYLYYWINNFNSLGTVDTDVYADISSFGVFNKEGTKTYVFYNPYTVSRTVNVYKRSDNSYLGRITLGPRSMMAVRSLLYNPQANLDNVIVYPNPYKPDTGGIFDNTLEGTGVLFDKLTSRATIKIFSIAGELVAELDESDGDGKHLWDIRNQSGERVASGVYIYLITNPDDTSQQAKGKFAIIK